MIKRIFAMAAVMAAWSMPAQAVPITLNFEGGVDNAAIGTLSGATFTNGFYQQCGGGCPPPPNGLFASTATFQGVMTVTFAALQSSVSFVNVSFSSLAARAFDSSNNVLTSLSHNQFAGAGPTLTLNAAGIRSVRFGFVNNQGNSGFGIDNLAFDDGAAPVPEPTALALLGLGLAGLGLARRRRSR